MIDLMSAVLNTDDGTKEGFILTELECVDDKRDDDSTAG